MNDRIMLSIEKEKEIIAAAGYKCPVKIELLKDAGLLGGGGGGGC